MLAEDMDATVEVVEFPPPPSPDVTIPFHEVLAMMELLRRHAVVIEGKVPAVGHSVADRLDHAVQEAGWPR